MKAFIVWNDLEHILEYTGPFLPLGPVSFAAPGGWEVDSYDKHHLSHKSKLILEV